MKSEAVWQRKLPNRDNVGNAVLAMTLNPDGSQLILAVGNRIVVYNTLDGQLVHSLMGHKDRVYAVSFSADGKRFASGGADNTVVIWTHKYEGILKYSHNHSIQCLAYNPVSQQLASGTAGDFGLWAPDQKSVFKSKVASKIISACWTPDGQYLALGHFNGEIRIVTQSGQFKVLIKRTEPIWSMAWNPTGKQRFGADVLAVGCWDETLSFYKLTGEQCLSEKRLGFDACSVEFHRNGEYLIIAGTNRSCGLYTNEGVFLKVIAECEGWVWTAKPHPTENCVLIGSNDGSVAMNLLHFLTIHGLYQDRYVHRSNLTELSIQHLTTEEKHTVNLKSHIRKIAVYRNRMAVQLNDEILMFETQTADPTCLQYRLEKKIGGAFDCNLLVVTHSHLVLCFEKTLQLLNFSGKKEMEWIMESLVRYIRVIGGPAGKENLLIGLKDGAVYRIFVDNSFPVLLLKHKNCVRCLDLSPSRKQLALVDDTSALFVFDLITKQVTFEEVGATSVAWNSESEEMFCFSGNGTVSVKTADFPLHIHQVEGFVVGFKGSKVFCLQNLEMKTVDVPQSQSMYRYLERKQFASAYRIACLGVTQSDWRQFASIALENLQFAFARKAFIRVRDVGFIELINRLELAQKQAMMNESLLMAEIYAHRCDFDSAVAMYLKANQLLDLRLWDKATKFLQQISAEGKLPPQEIKELTDLLLRRRAVFTEAAGDHKEAIEVYWTAQRYSEAIQLMGKNGQVQDLISKVRTLNKLFVAEIKLAADFFIENKSFEFAIECFERIDDIERVIQLHIEQRQWESAFKLLKKYPTFISMAYIPYAEWLALNGRFDEALQAFEKGGRPDQAHRMISELSRNALIENRFKDASFYYFLLSQQNLQESAKEEMRAVEMDPIVSSLQPYEPSHTATHYQRFLTHYYLAEIYYAYDIIFKYVSDPFTSNSPHCLLQTAQFLLNSLHNKTTPFKLAKSNLWYTLAKQSKQLFAYKTARISSDHLFQSVLRSEWRDELEVAALALRAKPFHDPEEVLPICYRCSSSNQVINENERCMQCQHNFIRSFCEFECLPLVEFHLTDDVSFDEAVTLINQMPHKAKKKQKEEPIEAAGADMLTLDDDDDNEDEFAVDSFQKQLIDSDGLIVLDRDGLLACPPSEVFIQRFGNAPPRFYRTAIKDTIIQCNHCQHFFQEEDYEVIVLTTKACPFCRKKLTEEEDSSL